MFLITTLFSILRWRLVVAIRWDAIVESLLDITGNNKVSAALCVPPLVDLIRLAILKTAELRVHKPYVAKEPASPMTDPLIGVMVC